MTGVIIYPEGSRASINYTAGNSLFKNKDFANLRVLVRDGITTGFYLD